MDWLDRFRPDLDEEPQMPSSTKDNEVIEVDIPDDSPTTSFAERYKATAADTSSIEDAKKEAANKKMWAGIFQGLSTAFAGPQKTNAAFYNSIRQAADDQVRDAEAAHQRKLADMLNERKISSTMDPSSPFAGSLRTLIKVKGINQLPEDQRESFSKYVDDASADELTAIAKQMGIGSTTSSGVRLVPGQKDGDRRSWFWADPNTMTMVPAGVDAPFAAGTVKDQLGDVYMYEKDGSGSPRKIFSTGQYHQAPEEKQFTETQLMDDLPPEKRKEVNRVKENFQKDPVVKKIRDGFNSANQIHQLLERAKRGEPIDRAQFGALMPRLAGEVGNLAEHDKAGWMKNPALINRAVAWFQQNVDGKMTPEDIEYVEGALAELQSGMRKSLEAQEAFTAREVQKITGYRPEDASRLIPRFTEFLSAPQSSSAKPASSGIRRKIDAFIEKNKGKFPSREAAIEFLKSKNLLPQDYAE